MFPRKAASSLRAPSEGTSLGATSPGPDIVLSEEFSNKICLQSVTLEGTRETPQQDRAGQGKTLPSGLCPLPVSSPWELRAGGAWGRSATRGRQAKGTSHVCGWPQGGPGVASVTLHPVAVACGSRSLPSLVVREQPPDMISTGEEVCREEPASPAPPDGLCWATSLTLFLGWCPSKTPPSRRASGVGFRDQEGRGRVGFNPGLSDRPLPGPRSSSSWLFL